MKKYSIATNSLAFVLSLLIGIFAVNTTLKPSSLEKIVDKNSITRIISIGKIKQISPDSIIFEYHIENNIWSVRLQITEDTKFHTSKTTIEGGIIVGREVKNATYSDMSLEKRVVIDWQYRIDKEYYVATDIIFVDQNSTNLLY